MEWNEVASGRQPSVVVMDHHISVNPNPRIGSARSESSVRGREQPRPSRLATPSSVTVDRGTVSRWEVLGPLPPMMIMIVSDDSSE